MTEGGIVGKIGLNEYGVGCCLNAIMAKGVDKNKIPIHLALRLVVSSKSAEEAIETLTKTGCASAGHIFVADSTTARGLEFSAFDYKALDLDGKNHLFHTNHYLAPHNAEEGQTEWVSDSPFRLSRIEELSKSLKPSIEGIQEAFKDEKNSPGSICRIGSSVTLFNIVMDLSAKTAAVTIGRPIDPDSKLTFSF
ncbi:AAT-domain-containing protein [Sugiyamaella lignohabitans]|uniref:AAT-domain-containing protein n=1 Tax=Sugiyamaella lignohabitans TaxID=796027 RepID=A0A167CP49_9ASCO|nr:AAT-domain-containing protein [Sugiyamaella lignohabitans]ANB11943.1 AAT-domain-containing protein [Sugiyamaella lignohabitans]